MSKTTATVCILGHGREKPDKPFIKTGRSNSREIGILGLVQKYVKRLRWISVAGKIGCDAIYGIYSRPQHRLDERIVARLQHLMHNKHGRRVRDIINKIAAEYGAIYSSMASHTIAEMPPDKSVLYESNVPFRLYTPINRKLISFLDVGYLEQVIDKLEFSSDDIIIRYLNELTLSRFQIIDGTPNIELTNPAWYDQIVDYLGNRIIHTNGILLSSKTVLRQILDYLDTIYQDPAQKRNKLFHLVLKSMLKRLIGDSVRTIYPDYADNIETLLLNANLDRSATLAYREALIDDRVVNIRNDYVAFICAFLGFNITNVIDGGCRSTLDLLSQSEQIEITGLEDVLPVALSRANSMQDRRSKNTRRKRANTVGGTKKRTSG
jgi:hypothetical protein